MFPNSRGSGSGLFADVSYLACAWTILVTTSLTGDMKIGSHSIHVPKCVRCCSLCLLWCYPFYCELKLSFLETVTGILSPFVAWLYIMRMTKFVLPPAHCWVMARVSIYSFFVFFFFFFLIHFICQCFPLISILFLQIFFLNFAMLFLFSNSSHSCAFYFD